MKFFYKKLNTTIEMIKDKLYVLP